MKGRTIHSSHSTSAVFNTGRYRVTEACAIDVIAGSVLKVCLVDTEERVVYARFQDGRAARISGLAVLPDPDDTILVGPNGWERVPDEIWTSVSAISVVREILPDGRILIDDGYTVKLVGNPNQISVQCDNTVEYTDGGGIVAVISSTPIRSQRFGFEDDDVAQDYLFPKSSEGLGFADFGGYPEVVKRARELINTQFERKAYLDEIGARPVRGILFSGPPGTGKTHLARIIANQSAADFYLVSGPTIVSKWLGDTEGTLRKIFEAAAKSEGGRSIIFFDEIDSIAERRTGDSHEASKRLVAQLLTLMDGFAIKKGGVVVIAATNRVETLDPALTRPGRFDWEIQFGMPSFEDRVQILSVGARGLAVESGIPFQSFAVVTEGWSAAELSSLWTEAALIASSDKRGRIATEDLAQAYERVASRPRRSFSYKDEA